jgi:hypothetical protein
MDDSKRLASIDQKLSALIALTAASLFEKSGENTEVRLEVLLSSAGLDTGEIAKVLGKSLAAVQKTLQRAKKQNG